MSERCPYHGPYHKCAECSPTAATEERGEPEPTTLIERLRHFEKNQLGAGDEYGAEVLHRAAKALEAVEQAEPVYQVRTVTSGKGLYYWKDSPKDVYERSQKLGIEVRALFTHPPAPSDGLREALEVEGEEAREVSRYDSETIRRWILQVEEEMSDTAERFHLLGELWNLVALASQAPAQEEENDERV